tara:strand:+ start:2406 stop:3824 length:1419 start_codon:yes stop_codon:yes gene_type:complete
MKSIRIIISVLVIFVFTSCEDYLEPVPTSVISGASFYADEAQLMQGVYNMYDGLQGANDTSSRSNHATQIEFYVTEMRSDNTRSKSGEGEAAQFDNLAVEATNGLIADHYRSFYNVIFRANTVLQNLGVASESNKAKIEGEAKFIRAYVYFNLVRLYGAIPLIDNVIGVNDDASYIRRPVEDIYDLIVSDLNSAVAGLDNSNGRNRATKAAAQGLLAKVHLTLGNYLEAQQLLESVMSDGFALEANFRDVFFNENNSEVIFSIGYSSGLALDSQNFSAEFLNGVGRTVGVNYVTDDAKAFMETNGGNRTAVSMRTDPIQPTQTQVIKFLPDGFDGGSDGKTFDFDARLAGNDWIVLRYADILLMHAEAILAGGTDTNDPAALASFQKVRDRAGLTEIVTSISKDDLLAERRVELAFENQRLYDIIRFGKGIDILGAYAVAIGANFTSNDLLLPFPQIEIGLSKGLLEQNPGY